MKYKSKEVIKVETKPCFVKLKMLKKKEINKYIYDTKQLRKIAYKNYIK